MKNKIKEILRENIEEVNIPVEEAMDVASLNYDEKGVSPGQYERLRNLLKNDIFNHAGIMDKLWGSKDATKRSLFRKKLDKMKNDEGGTYEFSKEEVSKIISIMMDISSNIKSAVKKKKK